MSLVSRPVLRFTILLLAAPLAAQSADLPEPGSREAIAAATTEPRFLSPWVDSVPESSTVPSPSDFLGHIAGAPGELTRTDKIFAYYRALAAASPRVKVEKIGTTEEGRDLLLVIVGEADSLKNLDAARADMAALADPRRTEETAMEAIVARAKPFYMLNGGLHSMETGSPEMLMELTYRLAVSEAPLIRQIRDRVTVLINPVAEPDGRDRQVDWFYRFLKGKTDFDNLPPRTPPYWGKYVFHDNNRDGVQRRLALTRAMQDAFLAWHPAVVHDLHESIPLLSIWTGTGPYNAHLDPILTTEWHAIAFHEVTALTSFGMPGAWTWGFTEGWSQFYADSVATNHNAIGRGYETFGNASAETMERFIDPQSETYTGKPVTDPDWYRSLPPPKKFKWSLRDNTNYMETGVLAALQYTSLNGSDMLRNFWRRGRNSVHKGETEKPYAIAIAERQDDPGRLAVMINLLRAHGIEVSRANAAFKVSDGEFPAGTYVVRMDQPYRGYALDLLTPQKFPSESDFPPYDDVAWALPFSLGVEVKEIADPKVRDVEVTAVEAPVTVAGGMRGSGPVYLIKDSGQEALFAARARLSGFVVEAAEKPFKSGNVDYPAGSWVIADQKGLREALAETAAKLGFEAVATGVTPNVARHPLDLPRLALLQTWDDTESPGWVRMIFDDEKIPYTLIMDDDVKRGDLKSRFDVILFPNTYDGLSGMVHGMDVKWSPLPYEPSPEFKALGTPTSAPDITGGLTWRGIGNIEDFVRQGGVLVTLGGASALPIEGGMVRGIRSSSSSKVFNPGSELRARFRRPEHPIAYGYKETTSCFREDRPLYSTRRWADGQVVLQWGTTLPEKDDAPADDEAKDDKKDEKSEPLLVSGGIKGADDITGKAAILDIPLGSGRVVAFDFDPIHRYTTMSDFRLVWNAILNWNDLPPAAPR